MSGNWLDHFFPQTPTSSTEGEAGLPSTNLWSALLPQDVGMATKPGQLPNATLIYGVASAVLFGVALYFLFTGMWLTSVFTMFPALALLGYALHFLRYPV